MGAVCEALEEAEKAIIELEFVTHDDPFSRWTTKGGSFAKQAVAAITALREGRDESERRSGEWPESR